MVDKATLGSHDYDSEPSSFQINVADITAANHDGLVTALATLRTATNALTLGGIDKVQLAETLWNTPVPTTDPNAQREHKWQVVVVEATSGRKYATIEIPMANYEDFLIGGSPYIVKAGTIVGNVTGTSIADWVTAFEAVAKSPSGLALSVWDMYQAGRNI